MSQEILKKHIAFITAHPDDETLLAGGTIHQNHLAGGKNSLFCATLGEKGIAYLVNPPSIEEMKLLRKNELLNVGKYIGIHTIEMSDLPDGAIEHHIEVLKNSVLTFITTHRPDILISFNQDGFTGHRDHVIISTITKEIAKNLSIPFFTFSKPPHETFPDFTMHLFKKRKNGIYVENEQKHKTPNIQIVVDPKVKLEALKLYESQFAGLNPHNIFPNDIAEHILNNEYFYSE
jgi:LmbE family N-acetylglucosaminyl deacetylase